jgi:hypothetical protein
MHNITLKLEEAFSEINKILNNYFTNKNFEDSSKTINKTNEKNV